MASVRSSDTAMERAAKASGGRPRAVPRVGRRSYFIVADPLGVPEEDWKPMRRWQALP